MSFKKLIQHPSTVVSDQLEGLVLTNPTLALLKNQNVVIRRDIEDVKDKQVSVICGGGSGHEPSFAGYVGSGLLSAAVCGEVFSSPSVRQVLECLRVVSGKKGTLIVIMNYTGDRLNFGIAAELARAEGYQVSLLVVADDCALLPSDQTAGRRGIAGTVLVLKAAGASAEEGKSLDQVFQDASHVCQNVRTMGVALGACVNPQSGKSSFTLPENEIEMGLGIHGEPGVKRQPIQASHLIVDALISKIVDDAGLKTGDSVIVLLNNLGGTTLIEISIVSLNLVKSLTDRGITVERFLSGVFMSSLEMAGISISLLKASPDAIHLIDAPTHELCAWKHGAREAVIPEHGRYIQPSPTNTGASLTQLSVADQKLKKWFDQTVNEICQVVRDNSNQLTELDVAIGDGDIGFSLTKGAHAILDALPNLPFHSPTETFRRIAEIVRSDIGGSSGPLYGIFFLAFARDLNAADWSSTSASRFAHAFLAGVEHLSAIGGAKEGDKTMIDALFPAARALDESLKAGKSVQESLQAMAEASHKGAENTKQMLSHRGRSSYLGERSVGHLDPGAVAVSLELAQLAKSFTHMEL